jgi:hypothetical protein
MKTSVQDPLVTLSAFCGGNHRFASRVLCFLCRHQFGLARISEIDFATIDTKFGESETIRYCWAVNSSAVRIIAARLRVPERSTRAFLLARGFNPEQTITPSRAERDEWIGEGWQVIVAPAANDEDRIAPAGTTTTG